MDSSMTCHSPDELILHSSEDEEDISFKLEKLSESSPEYAKIDVDFKNAGLTIRYVERLHNAHLKKRYVTERDLIQKQRLTIDPAFKLNEKYLYHGTNAMKDYMCEEGLDSRVSKEGCFGRGIYFSDYPGKCMKYAEKGETTQSIILLTRVILGDAKVYPSGVKDKTLKREPEKAVPFKGYRFYDSVEGCPVNHREFVVYDNRRALVEYIITYQKLTTKENSETAQAKSKQSSAASKEPEDTDTSSSDDEQEDHNRRFDPAKKAESDTTSSSSDDDYDYDDADFDLKIKKIDKSEETDFLEELESDFFEKTGVTDKHLIHVYLLMANQDVDKAVEIFEESKAETNQTGKSQDEYLAKMMDDELTASRSKAGKAMNQAKWKAMSAADKEATTKCLIEDFLSVIGRDKDDDSCILARKYLQLTAMNLDLAIIAYYEELTEGV